MGLLDFLKDKLGSGGSGTVTVEPQNDGYIVDTTMPPLDIKEGDVIKANDIKFIPHNAPDINYVGIETKAEMAKQLSENALLNAIFREVVNYNMSQLVNTSEKDAETREKLYMEIKAVESIKRKINKCIKDAEAKKVRKEKEAGQENYGIA